jgi:hypothetical protein
VLARCIYTGSGLVLRAAEAEPDWKDDDPGVTIPSEKVVPANPMCTVLHMLTHLTCHWLFGMPGHGRAAAGDLSLGWQ